MGLSWFFFGVLGPKTNSKAFKLEIRIDPEPVIAQNRQLRFILEPFWGNCVLGFVFSFLIFGLWKQFWALWTLGREPWRLGVPVAAVVIQNGAVATPNTKETFFYAPPEGGVGVSDGGGDDGGDDA